VTIYSSMIELISSPDKPLIFVYQDELYLYGLEDSKILIEYINIYDPSVSFVLYILISINKDLLEQGKDDGISKTLIIHKDAYKDAYKTVPPIYDENNKEIKGSLKPLDKDLYNKLAKFRACCNNCDIRNVQVAYQLRTAIRSVKSMIGNIINYRVRHIKMN
jgi:hypothetical protein